ncbi:hypothetical protein Efla_005205 [Eimeria flavescens]
MSRPIFTVSCLVLASLNLLTSLVGELGVFLRVEAALRATVVLLIMECLIAFLSAAFLLSFCVYEALNPKPLSRHWLLQHSVGLTSAVSAAVMLVSLLSLCSLGIVAEYQAELDAEAFLADSLKLKNKERQALLGRKKAAAAAAAEEDYGEEGEEGEAQAAARRNATAKRRARMQEEKMLDPRSSSSNTCAAAAAAAGHSERSKKNSSLGGHRQGALSPSTEQRQQQQQQKQQQQQEERQQQQQPTRVVL